LNNVFLIAKAPQKQVDGVLVDIVVFGLWRTEML